MKLFDSTKTDKSPAAFTVNNKRVACPHCGNDIFEHRAILLNTPGMTFFGFDWANRTAAALLCTTCGHIQWFAKEPERTPKQI